MKVIHPEIVLLVSCYVSRPTKSKEPGDERENTFQFQYDGSDEGVLYDWICKWSITLLHFSKNQEIIVEDSNVWGEIHNFLFHTILFVVSWFQHWVHRHNTDSKWEMFFLQKGSSFAINSLFDPINIIVIIIIIIVNFKDLTIMRNFYCQFQTIRGWTMFSFLQQGFLKVPLKVKM